MTVVKVVNSYFATLSQLLSRLVYDRRAVQGEARLSVEDWRIPRPSLSFQARGQEGSLCAGYFQYPIIKTRLLYVSFGMWYPSFLYCLHLYTILALI